MAKTKKQAATPVETVEVEVVNAENQNQPNTDLVLSGDEVLHTSLVDLTDNKGEINLAKVTGFDYTQQIAMLTPEQRKEYLAKANVINEKDITSIQAFGSEISKSVEDNGNTLLASVRSNNSNNEASQLINDLLAELKMVDMDDLSTSKLKRILRRIPGVRNIIMTADKVIIKYDNIKNNVDQIALRIKQHKIIAQRDNNTLDVIFDNNCKYIDDTREHIIAAKLKAQEIAEHIEYMKERPAEFSPIQVHDSQNFLNALQKRIADLQISEFIFNQNLFQIRAIQTNNMTLSNRAETIASTVIPIWKNQLSLSVIMINQQENIRQQKQINETTNKIIARNSQLMKENSIAAAKANEETIVSLDTLQTTTKDLIDTISEVQKIQQEGAKMRETLEKNLVDYGNQLTTKINELNVGNK